jgi:hypothetical protein
MPRIALAGLAVLVAFAIVVSAGLAQTETPTPTSARDEEEFAELREEALQRPLVYGPESGSLAMGEQNVSLATADVTVRDFAVHVTFTNPASAAEHAWDYGVVFRLTEERAYQLGVHSSGSWFLAVDTAQPDQTGMLTTLNLSANGTNSLDLIAIGERGYFGVNGSFVATLDLSANAEAGQVAVAAPFFGDSSIAGGSTAYEDFIIWSFDEGVASPAADGEGTPEAVETPSPGATVEASPGAGEAGNSYTSPTYGYTLTWDEGWQEVTRSSEDGYDLLRIGSDSALVDVAGFPWEGTAAECIDSLVNYYRGQEGYSDVEIAVDDAGNERRGNDGEAAWAIVNLTLTAEGQADAYTDYIECRPIVAGESMVSVEYLTFAAEFEAQEEERAQLLAGLTLPGDQSGAGTPVASVEATEGFGLGPVGLTLEEQNGSGASGLATLSETEDAGQTVVKVLVVGAPPGTVGMIHRGTCADLDPAPAFLLRPIDANGASETTIGATLRDLRVMDEYAIAIYASVEDLSRPIACGEIPTAG